jgi:hypothetical protein
MRCKICGCEYKHRCQNGRFHIWIQEHYESMETVRKVIKTVGDAIDEARKTQNAVGRGTRIKSKARRGSPKDSARRARVAGTLSLR